jgi:hypothetical protein
MPNILANKALEEYNKQIAEREQERQRMLQEENNKRIIADRYDRGITKAVTQFDLDFAGNEEHRALLDDIENLAISIRDPQNPSVIHEDAFEMATRQVLLAKGMFDKVTPKKENVPEGGFNKQTRTNFSERKTETLADKLTKRRLEQYEQYSEFRKAERRSN